MNESFKKSLAASAAAAVAVAPIPPKEDLAQDSSPADDQQGSYFGEQ